MRKILVAAVALLVASSIASAAVMTVEPLTIAAPGGTGVLNVTITGGTISGAQVTLVIGTPEALGGTDRAGIAPKFTGGSLGSMWGTADNQFALVDLGDGAPLGLVAANAALLAAGSTTNANGVSFAFNVTAGTKDGTWAIQVFDPLVLPNTVPLDVVTGSITVLPEPAAMVLLAIGGLFLRRR